MLPKGISMKLSSSGVLYPTKLPNLGDGTWFNGLKLDQELDPKELFPGSYCRSFAKIKKTATLRNEERAASLRSVSSFSIDAYAKEQRDEQRW